MENIKVKTKKICSLYVNDWHLTTMILPHIGKALEKNNQIATILESGIKENIEEILSKMNLNKEMKNKILQINWTSNHTCKYEEVIKQIQSQKIEIIVKGKPEYIENANKIIERIINQTGIKEITIINCYDISNYKNVNEILNKHEYILNTAGIKPICDMFEDKGKSIGY